MTRTAKGRILIIDDAGLVRAYYREALVRAGFDVMEALNGLEALEALLGASGATQEIGLLVVDINMPKMDGLTFLRTLRGQALSVAAIPALVTSTEASPLDRAAARAAGANFFLVKPVTPAVLVRHAQLLAGTSP
jgi:two-component system, chemotaxis family, chemotaxis protein CheY